MKLAIITTGLLPVPAVDGGAIESLITFLIEENEKKQFYEIDIFTCPSQKFESYKYQLANIIQVKPTFLLKVFCKIINHIMFITNIKKYLYPFDIKIYFKLSWRKYDIILVENSMRLYERLYKIKLCKDKLIYHMHNNIEPDNGDKNKKRTELVAKTAKKILVCSNFLKRQILEVYNTKNIEVLYNCIDFDLYSSISNDQTKKIKTIYSFEKQDIIIMYSGRISPEKGVYELAKAFTKIDDKNHIKLLIVGASWFTNREKTNYEIKIIELLKPYYENVVFAGYIKPLQMPEYYAVSDFIVMPTLCEEAFGMTALEAMAMKKPLIVTKSGGLTELVDETCAIVIEKDYSLVDNLTEAMKVLISNSDMRKQMGEAGYNKVINRKEFEKNDYLYRFKEAVDKKQ